MTDDHINLWDFCSELLPPLDRDTRPSAPETDFVHDKPNDLLESQELLSILPTSENVDVESNSVKAKASEWCDEVNDLPEDIVQKIIEEENDSMIEHKSTPHESTSSATVSDSTVVMSSGLVARLPLMIQTKLDCPRSGGCSINQIKSLPGGSACKGDGAIGSKHSYRCLCGLQWQENNWRERERLKALGMKDTRCVSLSKRSIDQGIKKTRKNLCSLCGKPKKGHICAYSNR